jgi:hypothetical protein
MNGMQMMLKSMGIDVDGITEIINPETVKQTLDGLSKVITNQNDIKASLLRIEMKLDILPDSEANKLLENSHLNLEPIRVEVVDANV